MKSNQLVYFVISWVATGLVLWVFPLVWRDSVVLGNDRLSPFAAAVVAAFIINLVVAVVDPVLRAAGVKSMQLQGLTYLVVDVALVWIIARLALYTGFGISKWIVAVIIAVILWVVQYVIWAKLGEPKK